MAQLIKGGTTKWLHDHVAELKGFAWQEGFGVFSVSKSEIDGVIEYIRNQEAHHAKYSFEDEIRLLYEKHGVNYDERYLLG